MKGSFQLTVNGEQSRVEGESINSTLLEYLRARGLTGSKDACGDGGCGACTVVLVDTNTENKKVFRSICSCVTPLPAMAEREIITVEGLCQSGELHPAQSALADSFGSQCGYCIPGMVMSLFEGYYRDGNLDESGSLSEQIGGSLCRCGAYGGLRKAGEACLREKQARGIGTEKLKKQSAGAEGATGDRFAKMLTDPQVELTECAYVDSQNGRFYRPLTMTALMRMRAQYSDARLMAGGIDSALHRDKRFRCLVSLDGIRELKTLIRHDDYWEVGAGVALADLQERIGGEYPALDEVLSRLGSRQIRNRATLGGSFVSPSPGGEIAVVLVAMGAAVRLISSEGEREVLMEAFYDESGSPVLRGDEIVKDVRIPRQVKAQLASRGIERKLCQAYKVSKRRQMDEAIVMACFSVELSADARIQVARLSFGGVGPKPVVRARKTEGFLEGRNWDWESIAAALKVLRQEFEVREDELASAKYRSALVVNLLEKFYREFSDNRGRSAMAAVPRATPRRINLGASNAEETDTTSVDIRSK